MPDTPVELLLLGAGGHAKVCADIARASGLHLVGAVDLDEEKVGVPFDPLGAEVVGTQTQLLEAPTAFLERVDADWAIIAIGHNPTRLRLTHELRDHLAGPLIHPSAIISPSASCDAGTMISPRVVVNAASVIGQSVILNTACVVEHDCRVGDGVHISPGAMVCGGVTVGDGAWIGAGATVIPGVKVGAHAIVGAGATVVRDVPAHTTVVGTPARSITP